MLELVEGRLRLLEVMRCTLEAAAEGRLFLLEMLDVPEVMRCVLLYMLEVLEVLEMIRCVLSRC